MNFKSKLKVSKSFTTTICLVSIAILSIVFQGCEKEEYVMPNNDLSFLSIHSNIDLRDLSEKDMNTLSKAIGRLDIYKKNGSYHIKQTLGAQVNISEDLFDFINSLYNHTNKIFKSRNASYSISRLKSGNLEGDPPGPSDCMVHSLSYGGAASYGSVGSYILSQYGSLAVPASGFYSVCQYFYPDGDTIGINAIPNGYMNNAIVTFTVGQDSAHAVNGTYYDSNNGYIMYWDEQNGTSGVLDTSDVYSIYQLY